MHYLQLFQVQANPSCTCKSLVHCQTTYVQNIPIDLHFSPHKMSLVTLLFSTLQYIHVVKLIRGRFHSRVSSHFCNASFFFLIILNIPTPGTFSGGINIFTNCNAKPLVSSNKFKHPYIIGCKMLLR